MTISIGTQGYMPKEQLGGNPRFSSDIYAVGIVGIQALTGTHPRFLGEDPQSGEINWHEQAPHASPELVAFLDRMVRYDFRSRYVTAGEALAALRSLPAELLESVPPPQPLPDASGIPVRQELSPPPTATGPTLPVVGLQPNPPTPAPPQAQEPPPPATATGQTLPVGGRPLNNTPSVSPDVGSRAKSSVPTVHVSADQRSQPSGTSAPMEVVQGFIQKYGIKPWQIVAAFVALGATAWIVKGLVSPQTPTQTASIKSASSVSPATSADPGKQAQELLIQADRQRKAESFSEAVATYEKAIALNSNDATAHWGLCFSLNQIGKPTEAIAQCDRALALNPNYPEALWSKGSAFEQQQQYEEAVNFYDQAIKLKPDYAEAWNNQGVALLKLKRPKEALEALDQATNYKPDWPDAWANRGAALWELKRFNQAIASIDRALQLDPEHPNANNLRQQARRKLGR